MWNWLNCYLSGRHDFGVTCASGSIFLQCIHCGKRSNGWEVRQEHRTAPAPLKAVAVPAPARTLPFVRHAANPHRRTA